MTIKMIKVDGGTHARLVELARDGGTTIGAVVAELAGYRRTHAEWAAIACQTTDYLRDHLGYEPTLDERVDAEAEHARIMDELDRQFAARRQARQETA